MKFYHAILILILINLSSCATTQSHGTVNDPFEPTNRAIFKFNEKFDNYFMEPLARAYSHLPDLIHQGFDNFFSNLGDVITTINDILQLKPEKASNDFMRVVINSSFGIGGIFDVATPLNIDKNQESFADTLGYWGVSSGPYIVIPFLGPSSVRDAPSLAIDSLIQPLNQMENIPLRNSLYATKLVNSRANLLKVTNLSDDVSFDPYTFQRDLYFQFRQNRIYDGDPPMENIEAILEE